ncbi:SDR family NAD(P)-dependent oxidoreductase [Mycobacterium lepromatosis]|uniref:SDR family NAD(P)-dependent oxidoreductase n=1 Tax=Mycobacterium lepromatosis TaxID=480418 RepID=UPI0006799501|nr:SDR family NAD(P)-dependent oxidoreductase [Mycobacterium lepromatosis]
MCWSPNAGFSESGLLEGFKHDEINHAFHVNRETPGHMTRDLLPGWQERGSRHFVFISSISEIATMLRAPEYAATKFRLRGFTLKFARILVW